MNTVNTCRISFIFISCVVCGITPMKKKKKKKTFVSFTTAIVPTTQVSSTFTSMTTPTKQ